MKKWIIKLVVGLLAIVAVVDLVYDFIANDTTHYFTAQPQRLLLVAVIAIIGGLATVLFDRLTPRSKRCAELLTLGLIGTALIWFAGWFLFVFARFPADVLDSELGRTLKGVLVCLTGAIALLCLAFHQVFKRAVE